MDSPGKKKNKESDVTEYKAFVLMSRDKTSLTLYRGWVTLSGTYWQFYIWLFHHLLLVKTNTTFRKPDMLLSSDKTNKLRTLFCWLHWMKLSFMMTKATPPFGKMGVFNTGVHKSWVTCRSGDQILYVGASNSYFWIPSRQLDIFLVCGASNFKMAPRFLEDLSNVALIKTRGYK